MLFDNVRRLDLCKCYIIIPVISKLFEHVILSLCEDCLLSNELQFGFKRDLNCSDSIFMLQTTIEYFNSRGSTVFLASLDIIKHLTVLGTSGFLKRLRMLA